MPIYYFILSLIHRVPFTISKHWQQCHTLYREGLSESFTVLRWNENRYKKGSTIALLKKDKTCYLYKITSEYAMPGSDWLGSNVEYELRFVGICDEKNVTFN